MLVSLEVLFAILETGDGRCAYLDRIDGIHDGVLLSLSQLLLRDTMRVSWVIKTNRNACKGASRHVLREREVGR